MTSASDLAAAWPVAGPSRPRVAYIGYLRVLAILGVIAIHVSGLTVVNPALVHERVWWVAALLNAGSRWAVPLFVMVSGALLLRPQSMQVPLGTYYRKRLSRIVPALVAWHVVYVLFELRVLGWSLTPRIALVDLWHGRTYTALYFFWLILGLYVVAPLLWRLVRGRSEHAQLLIALGFTAAALGWGSLTGIVAGPDGTPPTYTVLTWWIPYTGYFLLGPVLARVTVTARAARGWAVVLVGSVAVTFWQATRPSSQPGSARPLSLPDLLNLVSPVGYLSWFVAASTVALFLLARRVFAAGTTGAREPQATVVSRLGALTLGVFAIHLIVLYGLQHWPVPGLDSGATGMRGLVYLYTGTVLASFALVWGMARVPLVRRIV